MKRRNFLKWLVSILITFFSSQPPVKNKLIEDGFKHHRQINPQLEFSPQDQSIWYHVAYLPDKGYIITDSSDNIKEWLKQ